MPHVLDAHCTRRDWLRLGGLGAFGLSLPGLLRAADLSGRTPAARSCVLFLLHGGPSQLDTWDMKPSAPLEVRGEFKPIKTSVPGLHVCEHLPRLARVAHLVTVVRSMTHTAINHNTATYTVTTGQAPPRDLIAFTPSENDFPHLGAQVAYRAPVRRNLPTAVSLPDAVTDGPYTTPGQNGGFLGAGAAPFRVLGDPNDDEFRVDGLAGEPKRLGDRRDLLRALDTRPGRLGSDPAAERLDQYQQRALALVASDEARRAFDVGQEPDRVRERYGRHRYGQALLLARRLVEAGVRLVTVYWGGKVNNPDPHWDTHFNNNRRLKEELLPPFDQCFPTFLEDLRDRGLLESTLVIAMGEFGRTPRFGQFTGNGVNETGRDHWARCYSLLLAGGRAPGGRVLGRSDRFAAYPADDPYTPQDLCATVLHALGVNPADEVHDAFGRKVPLSTGRVCPVLFGT
jgi:Protein of unknown function (DUF1501)